MKRVLLFALMFGAAQVVHAQDGWTRLQRSYPGAVAACYLETPLAKLTAARTVDFECVERTGSGEFEFFRLEIPPADVFANWGGVIGLKDRMYFYLTRVDGRLTAMRTAFNPCDAGFPTGGYGRGRPQSCASYLLVEAERQRAEPLRRLR